MDAISRLYFDLIGRDKGASKAMSDVGAKAQQAHAGLSRLGSSLTGLGGPFDSVTMLAGNLGDAMDGTLGRAQKLGLGITAVGVALIAFAAKDQQAQSQLRTSIQDTGASYTDYRKGVEEAITTQEGFGHAANDTQDALNQLTVATQDPKQALDELSLAADIAAEKHENLADAAKQLVLAQEGNLRALRSFGISLDGQGTKTEQLNRALKTLQDRLAGQASAAVDTFGGHLKVLGAKLEDDLAKLGKFGPEITAAGAALTAYASILQLVAARKLRDVLATEAETVATEQLTKARLADTDAALAESGLGGTGRLRMLGRFGKGALIAGAGFYGAQAVGSAVGGTSGRYLSDIGGGASVGAGIGSIVGGPGLGTAVGAGVGAVVGLGAALLHSPAKPNSASVSQTEASYQKTLTTLHTLQAAAKTSTGLVHNAQLAAIRQAQAALKAGEANHQYARALISEASAAKTASVSIDDQLKKLNDSTTAALNLSDAEDGMRKAMHNAAQTAFDGTKALKGHTQSAIDNRDALRAVVKQEQDVLTAMRAHHASADKVRAAAIAMSKAIEKDSTQIYGSKKAVDKLLGSLGAMPGQMARSLVSFDGFAEKLNTWGADIASAAFDWGSSAGSNYMAGWNSGISTSGQATSDPNPNHNPGAVPDSTHKAAKAAGRAIGTDIVHGAAPVVDKGLADATKKALEKAKQLLAQQASFMRSELQQIIGAYQSTKQQLVDAASLANRQQGVDILGATGPAQSILQAKRQFAHQLVQFAHLLHRLEGAHYSRAIIDEVESLGAAAGIEAARELLAGGRKERREINRAERRIQAASGRISSQITSADYESEILKALQKLPDQFDRKFERTLARLNITTDTGKQDRKQGRRVRAA